MLIPCFRWSLTICRLRSESRSLRELPRYCQSLVKVLEKVSVSGHPRKINIAAKIGEAHESWPISAKNCSLRNSHNRMKTKSLENMGKSRLAYLPQESLRPNVR